MRQYYVLQAFQINQKYRISMDEGPSQLLKLPFNSPTHHISLHPTLPYLLHTSDIAIQNYSIQHEKASRCQPLSELPSQISQIGFSNKKIIYATKNCLKVNDHKIQVHSADIKHMVSDNSGIILTAAEDRYDRSIKITSTIGQKPPEILNQFNFHYEPITAMYWKNSLAITGDATGQICLWDINRCQTVDHRKVHYEAVKFIATYTDYNSNNVYYSVSPQEKRIIFSDLRSNKPIKILANLHSENIKSVVQTQSGRIFIGYDDIIDIIDIYKGYSIVSNFSPIVMDKLTQSKWTQKSFSFNNVRKITEMKVLNNKYLIVSCDNGCIQVYNTDVLQCLYGFGLVKVGPIAKLECSQCMNYVAGLDAEGDVYLAKFGSKLKDQ